MFAHTTDTFNLISISWNGYETPFGIEATEETTIFEKAYEQARKTNVELQGYVCFVLVRCVTIGEQMDSSDYTIYTVPFE